ncbi:cation/multidrug efflux pump [Rivularia sp. PCC 7116]|uniref:efflux RND transporter permease subunit n=1 Tax=Rivularia sp. PCC 7116 TaxID=373994 RepID=UPI00029F4769|nr:efflux RND transporter permease subunit [Rivularia sp. PCC 7116]AFY53199.1 cation/multidrug efflux pump [Rivularia sp. PCC 7116]
MFTIFYRNSRLLILTIVLIAVWGISSYFTLPRLEDPELVSRSAVVTTFFPGADAERVEALVTEKIEDKLTEIEEIDSYESTSRTSSSIIQIELQDTVKKQQVDSVWTRIRNKIDEVKVELPDNIVEPELEAVKVKAYALITGLTWKQDDKPHYGIMRRQAEVFKERLEAISGTEEVEIFGDPQEEIIVEINPEALAGYNLTARDLSQQIALSDSKISAGQLRDKDNNLLIKVAGELETLAIIRQIPISFGSQGQFVTLQNIATVRKGIREPANELALLNGYPGVAVAVHVQSGTRLDLWSEVAEKKIAEFKSELPQTIGLPIIFTQSNYVTERLNSLILNLLLGAGLVFSVTVIMMGFKSALIVSSALPLSVFMVFGWMNWLNIPLHQMSITGLIVALGILIDNAIVMVDEVQNELRKGIKAKAAINHSIKNLAIPLLSSTLTTVLAFLPIALLPGSTGEFVGTIAITVIIAVCCSLFISLTIIPTFSAKLHRFRDTKQDNNKNKSWLQKGIFIPILNKLYRRTVTFTVAKPVISIFLALLIPIMGFIQAGSLRQQFFPAADRDQLQIEFELTSSVSLEKTQNLIKEIRKDIINNPEVKEIHWLLGSNIPSFYYNLTGGKEQQNNYAQALVQLNSLTSTSITKKLQTQLDKNFPSARIVVRQLEQGPPFAAPIEMRIYGSNIEKLQSLGEQVRQILVNIKDVTHTRASLDEIQPQIEVQLDEEQARLAGLNRTTIAQQLDSTLEGTIGGSILEGNEELPVRVRLGNQERGNLSQITSLDLLANSRNNQGNNPLAAVPLSSLGKVQLKPELAQITHYNGQRVNTIQGFLNAGILPAEILSQFQTKLEDFKSSLPPNYRFEFGGEQEQRNDAVGGLVSTVGVLIILMIATLVLSLGSFQLAGVIGIVAVASFGLGLFSIWLFGYPFGFNPIIGSVGLIGVAVNDSIVVLSAISNHPIAKTGNPKAIQKVVLHSTRHVLTTTLTTAIGFVPLLLSGGEFWPPLAVAIAGGVVGATLLALYFVPAAYYLIKSRFGKKRFSTIKMVIDSQS